LARRAKKAPAGVSGLSKKSEPWRLSSWQF
jgi:hypothetical protein